MNLPLLNTLLGGLLIVICVGFIVALFLERRDSNKPLMPGHPGPKRSRRAPSASSGSHESTGGRSVGPHARAWGSSGSAGGACEQREIPAVPAEADAPFFRLIESAGANRLLMKLRSGRAVVYANVALDAVGAPVGISGVCLVDGIRGKLVQVWPARVDVVA